MSWFSSIAPAAGAIIGGLLAAPTGGMSIGMGAALGGLGGMGVSSAVDAENAVDAQNRANQTNIDLQVSQRDWEERMANSAYQRAVADMKAAGINPVLVSKLGGAATPIVAPAQVQSPAGTILEGNKMLRESVSATAMQYLQAQSIKETIATQKSQQLVNSAQAHNIAQDTARKVMENQVTAGALQDMIRENKYKFRYRSEEERFRAERSGSVRYYGTQMKDFINTFNPLRGLFKFNE